MMIQSNRFRAVSMVLAILFTVPVLAGAAGAAETPADDCPRGDLDARYCDRAGDLVADPPENPDDFIDPNTLIFAAVPGEDPATYESAWRPLLDLMEELTGRNVEYFYVDSFAAQVEAMRAGRAHIGGVPTGNVPTAVNQAGFIPRKVIGWGDDGNYGYYMWVIAHADNDEVNTLEDLRNRTVAFVDPGSNSGFQAPAALLFEELNMIPDEDYQTTFSGSHDNSIMGVEARDYEVAAIADTALFRLVDSGLVDEDSFKVVYESNPFPPVAWGHVYNLDEEIAEQVVEAFRSYDWSGTELEAQYATDGDAFLPITYKEAWQVIRDVDAGLQQIGLD